MKRSNGPRQLHSLPSSSKVKWEKYEMKKYLHFDKPLPIEILKSKIQNPTFISSHAFYPSIHFNIVFNKYVKRKDGSKVKERKERSIQYSSHQDQFIYKYYGDLLNNAYNKYTQVHGIDNVATAYRNNKGTNNIDFAYEIFDYLFSKEKALVISLDFTSFFDNIDHKKLKSNIKEVLGVKELEDDWYKVFKNTTKYSYIEKHEIDEFLKDKYGVKRLKRWRPSRIMNDTEFREFKKGRIRFNTSQRGIPQGSGMSAVCSNIHLIHFDQDLNNWAKEHLALYRRYCDDLILVIPLTHYTKHEVDRLKEGVLKIVKKYKNYGLELQDKKTEIRLYKDSHILNENLEQSTLDYLGFVTDGRFMRIREKSLFKYYTRAYRKAKTSKRISLATRRPGPKKELYDIYTHLGFNYKNRGNFISYAQRAHMKMNTLKTHSLIKNQIKNHWNKIHKIMKI